MDSTYKQYRPDGQLIHHSLSCLNKLSKTQVSRYNWPVQAMLNLTIFLVLSSALIASVQALDKEELGLSLISANSTLGSSSRAVIIRDIQPSVHHNSKRSPTGYTVYQPALIGFRCETVRDVTSAGVSVVEANIPVTLTLYGESFTTDTIVAFTTDFRPHTGLDPVFSQHIVDQTKQDQQQPQQQLATTTSTTTSVVDTTTTSPIEETTPISNNAPPPSTLAQTNQASRRFANRRRTQSGSYDCTDYNRVTSYKLTEENILSPNVATLTVTLPELDSSGMNYYFCLKQPPLSTPIKGFSGEDVWSTNFSSGSSSSSSNESLVWVHQGDEWWVTLKVEAPFLSVTNDCFLIVILLLLSAVASGLNLGLMSLDMNELAVISACGDQRERSYARTIMPLRKRGNYLLCSLLFSNVAVNASLTVVLEQLTSGLVAVIGSTLAIVILGEIGPQAICARQGLAIGAKTIYITYAFMILTFPLSYPISYLLDIILGEEAGHAYDRERLMEFIKITGHHTQLESDEIAIISGALKLKKIKVDQIMTRIEDVFMLPIDCKLDRETIKRIIMKGYSRIPVYDFDDRRQIVALILAKDLALLDPDDHTPIEDMLAYCKHPLIFIDGDATLDVALNEFKTGKSHMAVVRQIFDDGEVDKYYEAIGVVTLEDVIEEVLQVEINDETDTLSDNRRKRRRTDAQVAHLIDELTLRTSSSTSARLESSELVSRTATGILNLGTTGGLYSELPALSKQVQTSLSSHLTSISIGGVAQSLSQSYRSAEESPPPIQQQQQQQQQVASPMTSEQPPNDQSSQTSLHHRHQQHQLLEGNQPQSQQQQQQQQQSGGESGDAGMLTRAAQFLSNIIS